MTLDNVGKAANLIAVLQITGSTLAVCYRYVVGVNNAPRDRDRLRTELVALYTVLDQVLQLANEESGRTSRVGSGQTSRLSALDELLYDCGNEMRRLRKALGEEMESFEMGSLEAAPDGYIELSRERERLEKILEQNSRMEEWKWPLSEAEVNKAVGSIRKFVDSLNAAMEVDQTRLILNIDTGVEALQAQGVAINQSIQNTGSHIGDIAGDMQETSGNFQSMQRDDAHISEVMEQAQLQEHRREISAWLAAPGHLSKHTTSRGMRDETTGSWFVEGESFQEWRDDPHSFLWLFGIPGAGKTILCSTIVDALSTHCRSDHSRALAFFYFDFNNKDTLPNAVLRSLIEQLSSQCASTPPSLESLFSKNKQARQAPGQEDLMSTLKTIISSFQAVYIVFDALDECPQRSGFLEVLGEVHDWELDTLHLLATSRDERDIAKALSGLVSHEVSMDESLVDGDIQVYISRRLAGDVEFKMCSAAERVMVETTLTQGAHGMFRWVVCQMDALQKCRTPAALEKALIRLPRTLYETYDRILAGIDEDDRRDALSLLQWLAFSVGTLSMDEAVEVLATDPDAREGPLFDERRRLLDPSSIVTICSSLVTITPPEGSNTESSPYAGSNPSDTNYDGSDFEGSIGHHDDSVLITDIRLAHFSVREYLISEHLRSSTTTLSYYWFNEKIAHVFIAKTCLAYLLQFNQDNGVNRNTARSYPLSHYAAVHWMGHALWDAAGGSADLHGLTMTLLEPMSAAYVNWMWIYNNHGLVVKPGIVPLYIAAATGLDRACQALLDKGSDVNAPGGYYGTPLQVAASQGHDTTVQLLLEMGADVNSQGGFYGNALQAAVINGHDTIVRLLLGKGTDVNAQGGKYGSALQAAASQGLVKIVQLLLAEGADVKNVQGSHNESALQVAASRGHHTIVQLLLEKGADMNAQEGVYGSVLQAAVANRHHTIVQLLIEKGVDVNTQGGHYGSALQAAASWGETTIVQLLLENGASVNPQGGIHGNALQAAVSQGHAVIAQLLLEKGADVNAQGAHGESALEVAALWGYDTIVHLLLEEGADAQGASNKSVLVAAASRGHDTIVRLLLDKGADVNAQGGYYGSALQEAVFWGHEATVRLLIDKGADINAQGGKYGCALQLAVVKGHDVIASLLLETAAAAPNMNPRTALSELKLRSGWVATFSRVDVDLMHTLIKDRFYRRIFSVHFSAKGRYLAAGTERDSAEIYDTVTGERKHVFLHDSNYLPNGQYGEILVRTVRFSPNRRHLATGLEDNHIRIWNIAAQDIISTYKCHKRQVTSLDFSRDNRLLVSGSLDNTVCIWDMKTRQHHKTLSITVPEDLSAGVFSVAFSPNGHLVAAGYHDSIVRLWDVQTEQLVQCLVGHTDRVLSVAFTPDGKGLVSGSGDQTLKHWDLRPLLRNMQRRASRQLGEEGVEDTDSALREEGSQNEGVCVCTVNFTGHTGAVLSIAISQDDQWVVSGSDDRSVRFWDLRTGEAVLILHGHKDSVLSVDLSRQGGMLATSDARGVAKLWSYQTLY